MSATHLNVLLEHYLKQLKMPTMLREHTAVAATCSKENVLLIRNPGTEKTHLATALGHTACSQGKRVGFFTVTGVVTHMREAREER